ncbi:MAG: DNA-processing protein DprA [Thermodesulfobacteriota bacterium]|nr:DNA-processing protein DprA [Thermodesulfobacteriota bacterium]
MDEKIISSIKLRNIPGVGDVQYKKLIMTFKNAENVFNAPLSEIIKVDGIGEKVAFAIKNSIDNEEAVFQITRAEKTKTQLIPLESNLYPRNLKNIYDPPSILFVKGALEERDMFSLSIVGSRNPSHYGKNIAEHFAHILSKNGFVIVSGLARGIDAIAHLSTQKAGGKTIAVLGCGIDICYPSENKKLYNTISKDGAIITEFPFATPPHAVNFPVRNRIISGLSLGVLIIEAASKSGSLITARLANDQGREVFAIPGSIFSPKSKGTHKLIKLGAQLVETPEEIIETLLPQLADKRLAKAESYGEKALSQEEREILGLLSHEPLHIDSIIAQGGLDASMVLSILLNLEIDGLVTQLSGMLFVKKEVME